MRYELVAPDGSVASAGDFTEADALAPDGGLIDQLANVIASRQRAGIDDREQAKWLPLKPRSEPLPSRSTETNWSATHGPTPANSYTKPLLPAATGPCWKAGLFAYEATCPPSAQHRLNA